MADSSHAAVVPPCIRRRIRIGGIVQGVGLRPTLCRLARSCGLSGFVRNEGDEVRVEVEGDGQQVARFIGEIPVVAPAAARIERVEVTPCPARSGSGFDVAESAPAEARAQQATSAAVPPDLAPCEACLRELQDPRDRRFRYPFINCTSCGPRFTIVRGLPYDRIRTTMARFALCGACRREYLDAEDRRFHAEPIACPACGPQLSLVVDGHVGARGEAALLGAARALAAGGIVALKGVGGFALAADAASPAAVSRLRERKRRPSKPFAVMARGLLEAEAVAVLGEAERRALLSPARPIVLAPLRPGSPLAAGVAPGLAEVGLFLPPSPLQHLLLSLGPPLQVMTSGNLSDEPIATGNGEALERLAGIADAFLLHDRDIEARADDSVVRVMADGPVPLRRARGFVPGAIALPAAADAPPVLAVGGETKGAVCLVHRGRALLSPHIGDLSRREGLRAFEAAIAQLRRLTGVEPRAVAHDLHPDYRSTRWALACGLPPVPVQHHHAHVAACLAEHGRAGPVIGVAFDGTGYGPGGALWGGEVLAADLLGARRLGHLRPIRLLGGEAAIREPWRLALAALLDAGEPPDLLGGVERRLVRQVERLWDQPAVSPPATGAGRWFDAVAALCGLRTEVSYDGQAAAELEAAAQRETAGAAAYDFAMTPSANPRGAEALPFVIDLRPAVREICAERRRGERASAALRFHETMAQAVLGACRRARDGVGLGTAVLTGGCFQNRLLADRAAALLRQDGFEVLTHRQVPPNDGGLALGQAAVASACLARGRTPRAVREPSEVAPCAWASPVR